MRSNERAVIFVGSLPPPVGGQSLINSLVLHRFHEVATVKVINLSANALDRGYKYHVTRISRFIAGMLRIAYSGSRSTVVYISLDSGLGLFYSTVLSVISVLRGCRLSFHHHSFTYIDRWSIFMAGICRVGGATSSHVFLCRCMRDRFLEKYPSRGPCFIVSNLNFLKNSGTRRSARSAKPYITIGLISHLSDEKGLDIFLQMVRETASRSLPIRFMLAGPTVSDHDLRRIDDCKSEFPEILRYLGPVFGEEKQEFFEQLDLFVFPTKFRVEAQPLVLFESMSAGVPVISFDRGCIAEDLSDSGAVVLASHEDFVALALDVAIQHHSDPTAADTQTLLQGQRLTTLQENADRSWENYLEAVLRV